MRSVLGLGGTFLGLAALAGPAAVGSLQEVQTGDSLQVLREKAGEAVGTVQAGDKSVHVYGDGKVTLADGRVVAIELKDPEAEAMRLDRLTEAAEHQAARDAARIARGAAAMSAKLADPVFRNLPTGTRLSYWMQFRRLYPEVDVTSILQDLYREMDREAEWEALQARREEEDRGPGYYRRTYRGSAPFIYGGSYYYRPRPEQHDRNREKRPAIIEYPDATLFAPGFDGLPSGPIR